MPISRRSRYKVSTSQEINAAFATFAGERPDALFFAGDGFFTNRRVQLVNRRRDPCGIWL